MSALARMQKAVEQDFRYTIDALMMNTAVDIVNESDTEPNHSLKMTVARKILNGQINITEFAKAVVVDEDLGMLIDTGAVLADADVYAAVVNTLMIFAKSAI